MNRKVHPTRTHPNPGRDIPDRTEIQSQTAPLSDLPPHTQRNRHRTQTPQQDSLNQTFTTVRKTYSTLGPRSLSPPAPGHRPTPSSVKSLFGVLSLTSRTVKLYSIEPNQNTEQTILALDRLQRETEAEKIAVLLDNARSHHVKMLTGLYEPGQMLEHITPVFLPPYAPDHNPVEHVWNTAKNNTANIQRETPEETFGTFASYSIGRTFDYDFEHLPPRDTENDLVS